MRVGLIAAASAAALLVAAPAQAAKYTYAGATGGEGKVAFDVKVKHGAVTKLTAIRMVNIPMTCATSGDLHGDLALSGSVPIPSNGKFAVDSVQPDHGNITTVKGKFTQGKVKGQLDLSYHYAAQEGPPAYPEEDCSSGPLKYKATFGAQDETLTPPAGKRGR